MHKMHPICVNQMWCVPLRTSLFPQRCIISIRIGIGIFSVVNVVDVVDYRCPPSRSKSNTKQCYLIVDEACTHIMLIENRQDVRLQCFSLRLCKCVVFIRRTLTKPYVLSNKIANLVVMVPNGVLETSISSIRSIELLNTFHFCQYLYRCCGHCALFCFLLRILEFVSNLVVLHIKFNFITCVHNDMHNMPTLLCIVCKWILYVYINRHQTCTHCLYAAI